MICAIVQARMGSSRLPGKVLLDLGGEPILGRVLTRLGRASTIDEILVATSTESADDVLAATCRARGWLCFRGSETDVLDRYYQAATARGADVVVRITADCPLIDPAVVDLTVRAFLSGDPPTDYVSNDLPEPSFPRGLDTEVFSYSALERAWREDHNPGWREHVTPFLYRRPDLFRTQGVRAPEDYSSVRWTVDTRADYDRVVRIYAHFGHDRFTWLDVIAAEREHPEWGLLNQDVLQRVVE
jgi:spore coat polysaccharide biosynthesis protein SpsF